jgi:quercetin dioxygenase-like cupin family protein
MSARLHRFGDATSFQPEGHSGVSPVRMTGTSTDESIGVVLSTYEPGAHADLSPVPVDTVYTVYSGQLTITIDDEPIELNHLDSLFLPAGCVRAVDNFTAETASMFVIRPNP